MGFSAGGLATLQAVQLGGVETLMKRKFKAAIAYYPLCRVENGDMAVQTLILIGELDDWTPPEECREMMTRRSGTGSDVQLLVYEGAHHAFDSAGLKAGAKAYGHWMEYNPVAADRSISDVRDFLQRAFDD